jgi:thiamine pyrophosphate-dependent acetolactate synthase large subunit-like protein
MLQACGIVYAACNPGASFRGLHDSIVNYGGNHMPELIQCCHEEISVALAHGYAKATGTPMAALIHNIVGLQHASMALFNAWCDRAPVLALNQSTGDSYTHAAILACASAVKRSTAAVISGA